MTDEFDFAKNLANNMVRVQLSVSLCPTKRKSAQASATASSEMDCDIESRVGFLGSMTQEMNRSVNSMYRAIRTYFDETHSKEAAGTYLVYVPTLAETLAHGAKIRGDAYAAKAEFMPRYREYYKSVGNADFGKVTDVQLPHPDLLESDYLHCVIGEPQILPDVSVIKDMPIPAGLAQELTNAGIKQMMEIGEREKQNAISKAMDHLEIVIAQCDKFDSGEVFSGKGKGPRMSQSLIDNARVHAQKMRNICSAYDQDTVIKHIADRIENEIGGIGDIDKAKNSASVRQQMRDVAKVAVSSIKATQKAEPIARQATCDGMVAGEGLIAELSNTPVATIPEIIND